MCHSIYSCVEKEFRSATNIDHYSFARIPPINFSWTYLEYRIWTNYVSSWQNWSTRVTQKLSVDSHILSTGINFFLSSFLPLNDSGGIRRRLLQQRACGEFFLWRCQINVSKWRIFPYAPYLCAGAFVLRLTVAHFAMEVCEGDPFAFFVRGILLNPDHINSSSLN